MLSTFARNRLNGYENLKGARIILVSLTHAVIIGNA